MEIEVKMPDLSTTGSGLIVLKWLVEVGASVKRGDALVEVETDKATIAVEAAHAGVLKKQLVQADETVLPGEVIAIVEVQQLKPLTTTSGNASPAESARQPSRRSDDDGKESDPKAAAALGASGERVGMFARNRASRHEASATSTPLSTVQRVVARRMVQSKQTIPHYYLQASACVDGICRDRAHSSDTKIAWDAYFACAVAKSLKRFPKMCCRFQDDYLVSQPSGAIGVAVDVNGELYVVPIRDAAAKSAVQISNDLRTAYRQLKAGSEHESKRLQPADITVTNLGMTAVESFLPIINPTEAAILGIGRIQPQPVAVDSQVVIQQRVTLTLAVDHRIVNGKCAAEFLGSVVEELESWRPTSAAAEVLHRRADASLTRRNLV
jgi:pyruvate/2-oxoglutarate dehydrogenase complex dihydrolipoamide acyltransferase (E2) component